MPSSVTQYVIITAFIFTASSDEAFPIISQKAKKANVCLDRLLPKEF